MKHLTCLIALVFSLTIPFSVEAQKRNRKKPSKRSTAEAQAEAQATAELDLAWRDEVAKIRQIDPVRRAVITIPIDNLLRACQLYKVTNDMNRAESEFYTDATLNGFKQAIESLPDGFLKFSLGDGVQTFGDAQALHRAYYRFEEISNSKILEIVRNNKLEDVPRLFQISTLMARACKQAKETNEYARRAGLPVSEN